MGKTENRSGLGDSYTVNMEKRADALEVQEQGREMEYQEKEICLKDGSICLLRNARPEDAAAVVSHMQRSSAETDFMARYADEIRITPEEERSFLAALQQDPKGFLAAAFVKGELAATAGFSPIASYERYGHRAECGMSVLKDLWGLGIGRALLEAVIETARRAGYEQLELEVVEGNRRAEVLYEKLGFCRYGRRERSFRYRDGSYAAFDLMLLRL